VVVSFDRYEQPALVSLDSFDTLKSLAETPIEFSNSMKYRTQPGRRLAGLDTDDEIQNMLNGKSEISEFPYIK
jgi:hypothetical protein